MALINCPECFNEVSDKAKLCPHCGVDIQEELRPKSVYSQGDRECCVCGYRGKMRTWFQSSGLPVVFLIIGLSLYIIPGLIFWMYAWGRIVCPRCGTMNKSITI